MIDFHSHILPNIDDGSQSVEESIALLKMLKEQGVDTVVATPHFTATKSNPQEFFNNRQKSYEKLMAAIGDDTSLPKIKLGAEVLYYTGISRMQQLSSFCIEGTNLLLLEMPTTKWSNSTIREVMELSCSGHITVVLAHIERYLKKQEEWVINKLFENDVLMQVNAQFLIKRCTRRKALRLLKNGFIQMLGSDCHGVVDRPPQISEAREIVVKKLGDDFIRYFEQRNDRFMEGLS